MITARTSSHIKDREGVKIAEVMAKMFIQRDFLRPSGGQFRHHDGYQLQEKSRTITLPWKTPRRCAPPSGSQLFYSVFLKYSQI